MRNKNFRTTLQLRVSPKRGIMIINRLYGCGEITKSQYDEKLKTLLKEYETIEKDRKERIEELCNQGKVFYKTTKDEAIYRDGDKIVREKLTEDAKKVLEWNEKQVAND